MYVGVPLQEKFHDTISDVVLGYIISLSPFGDQISSKPMIFFAQVANIVSQDLLEAGTNFRKTLINSKIVDFLASTLDFRNVPNLLRF